MHVKSKPSPTPRGGCYVQVFFVTELPLTAGADEAAFDLGLDDPNDLSKRDVAAAGRGGR
ncbi:hypothetical protein ARSEF1564_003289 [Beauveria bassiana]